MFQFYFPSDKSKAVLGFYDLACPNQQIMRDIFVHLCVVVKTASERAWALIDGMRRARIYLSLDIIKIMSETCKLLCVQKYVLREAIFFAVDLK